MWSRVGLNHSNSQLNVKCGSRVCEEEEGGGGGGGEEGEEN